MCIFKKGIFKYIDYLGHGSVILHLLQLYLLKIEYLVAYCSIR